MTSPSERSISSRARRLMTAKAKQSVIPPEGPGTGQSGHPPIAIPMPRGITRRRIRRTSPTTMSFLDTTRNYHRPPHNPDRLQSAGVIGPGDAPQTLIGSYSSRLLLPWVVIR